MQTCLINVLYRCNVDFTLGVTDISIVGVFEIFIEGGSYICFTSNTLDISHGFALQTVQSQTRSQIYRRLIRLKAG